MATCSRCNAPPPVPRPALVSGSCIECHAPLCCETVEERNASAEFAAARGIPTSTRIMHLCSLRPGHDGPHWNRAIGGIHPLLGRELLTFMDRPRIPSDWFAFISGFIAGQGGKAATAVVDDMIEANAWRDGYAAGNATPSIVGQWFTQCREALRAWRRGRGGVA